jgi:hypothetical protein
MRRSRKECAVNRHGPTDCERICLPMQYCRDRLAGFSQLLTLTCSQDARCLVERLVCWGGKMGSMSTIASGLRRISAHGTELKLVELPQSRGERTFNCLALHRILTPCGLRDSRVIEASCVQPLVHPIRPDRSPCITFPRRERNCRRSGRHDHLWVRQLSVCRRNARRRGAPELLEGGMVVSAADSHGSRAGLRGMSKRAG